MRKEIVTIFTPTYNRAHTLGRLYESLLRQTDKRFEWLVIDDGSIDETKSLFDKWIKENKIVIKYIYQENGGKPKAHNTAVENCDTEIMFIIDSDDYLVDSGVEKTLKIWEEIRNDDNLAGFMCYCGKNNNETLSGYKFPDIKYGTEEDLVKRGFIGDLTYVFKTDVLKQYLFPDLENEKFIQESYVWMQLELKYRYLIVPEIFKICEYLEDGLTRQSDLIAKNPKSYALYQNMYLKCHREIGLKNKIRRMAWYISYSKIGKVKHKFKKCSHKGLYLLTYPLVMVWYHLKFKKLHNKILNNKRNNSENNGGNKDSKLIKK